MTVIAQTTKGKIDKSNLIKIFKLCAEKDTINGVKNTLHGMGKIFANHISDKGLIFRICKELLQLNDKNPQ